MRTDWMKNNDKFGDDYSKMMVKEIAENTFEDYLKYSPESTIVIIDGTTVQAIVQNHVNVGNRNKDDMRLSVRNSVAIRVGSIVEWDSRKWIVTKPIDVTLGYQITSMFLSTHEFKFYHDNQLYELDTFIRTGDTDVVESRLMPLNVDEYIMVIRDDLTSRKLSQNTRFILDDKVYKVMGHDTITEPGIMKVKIKIDQFSEKDNRDLNIADYYNSQNIYSVLILNGDSVHLHYQEETLQLNIEARKNGIIVDNPDVSYFSDDEYVATVDENGLITANGTGVCNIFVTYNDIVSSIEVEGKEVVSDYYNLTILPDDDWMYINSSKVFTVNAFNNGVEDTTQNFYWSIENTDGSSNTYASIVDDNNTCTVKSHNYVNKHVKIKATLYIDPTVFIEKEIRISGLI